MDRQIVCFEVPALQVALARLKDPSLLGKPVAIASLQPRNRLQEVSTEAHHEGLSAGMPVEEAYRRCRSLHVYPPEPLRLRDAERQVMKIVGRYAPIWEPLRPGHMFFDLTGTTRLFGMAVDLAVKIEREVAQQVGLPGVVGVGTNKLVSRMAASLVPPLQVYEVWPGGERSFVAPLPIVMLPAARQHEPALRRVLDDLNLRTLGQIAEIPFSQLGAALGRWAAPLYHWANGLDHSPVKPTRQQYIIEESLEISPEHIDESVIHAHFFQLLERLCTTLRSQHRLCGRLSLTLVYAGGHVVTRYIIVPPTQWEADVFPSLQMLLRRVFTRRVRVRSLSLAADRLLGSLQQLGLFEEHAPSPRAHRLATALDQVRTRYGERSIVYGRTLHRDATEWLCYNT